MGLQSTEEIKFYTINTYNPQFVRKNVNVNLLTQDIQRGVTTLSEDAYTQMYGTTMGSLAFTIALLSTLGEEKTRAKRAQMTLTSQHHYTLRVTTFSGFTLVFKGVSGGYFGEGSRGAYDILRALGFSQKQAEKAFKEESFVVQKRAG